MSRVITFCKEGGPYRGMNAVSRGVKKGIFVGNTSELMKTGPYRKLKKLEIF